MLKSSNSYDDDIKQGLHNAEMSIGSRIGMAIKAAKTTQAALADHVGISASAVSQWIADEADPKNEKIAAIADFLHVTPEWLMFGDDKTGDAVPFAPVAVPQFADMRDSLPVFGTAEGGGGLSGEFDLNGTVVDRVKAPPALTRVLGAYGLYVRGDSMEPRYFEGELLYVHPHKPVAPGCFVVIQLKPETEDGPIRAVVKKLAKRTATKLVVEQYNPPNTYEIDRAQVLAIHRILNGEELI